MMSRIYLVFILLVSMTLLVSYEDNPPNGRTGAPGDGICSDCHSLDGGTQDGILTVSGLPALIAPNTAYILTITNSNPNTVGELAGFQLTILNGNNQKAGTMSSPSANSVVTPSGGRDYWEHNPAQPYPANNMVSWTVTWTSPTMPPNTMITAYAAGNVANDSGDNDGDLIITTTASGMLQGGVAPLEAEIVSSTDVLCNGGNTGSATAGATGGTTPYTFAWSNGDNTATIINLTAGTYTVTVSDDDGSTSTASVLISQPSPLVFQNPNITNVSCFGGSDGAIQASASGGTFPYTFAWSNGSSGSTINGLVAGSYSVTVTDENSCTKTATYQVTQPAIIEIELDNLMHESCAGQSDGAISILVTGGVAPIFAEWSNGFIGNTITDLSPDTYSVTVTDNNDCTQTASYTINPGGVVNVSLEDLNNVTCNGGNNGSISVSANGGQSPYTFDWSNGATGPIVSDLSAGNYLVTATDFNGCEVVKLYTISQPDPVTITINTTGQNFCFGDSLVDLIALPAGTQPPFTGVWSNGVAGLINNNLSAGSYTITVTDDDGCTASASATVTAPSALVVTVITTDETSAGANDGTAKVSVTGGTPAYTYLWSTGSMTDSISGLAPGTYTVTITDQNACTIEGIGQVDEFGCSLDVSFGPAILICEDDTISAAANIIGGIGDMDYLWSTGDTTETILISSGGEYCLTVIDMAGCQDVDCIIINEDVFPVITCPVTNESAPGANDGAISCDSISGSILYAWSNGATTSSISGLTPGDYCVTMTNSNACTGVQCFTVQPAGCQLVVTSIIAEPLCAGDSTGSIGVNVENATQPVSYEWAHGDTTATVTNLVAGDYSVTILDGAGCLVNQSYTVNEPTPVAITIDEIVDISDIPGYVNISISGGIPPYSYVWTFPDSTTTTVEDLSLLLLPGFYSVVVTDANGCESSATVLVEFNVAVDPSPVLKPIKVYPVPTQDFLHVELNNEITEALIMGIDGRLYKRILNPASNNLQVGELEPGWYIIRMTDGQSWYVARMVK